MGARARRLTIYELTYVAAAAFLALGALVQKGVTSSQWNEFEFVVTFVCTGLLFAQIIIRYISSASLYRCERSFLAWLLTALVTAAGMVLISMVGNSAGWLVTLGVMLVLLALKDTQIRDAARAVPDLEFERTFRLRETATLEAFVGLLIALFGALCVWGTRVNSLATPEASAFFGVLVAGFCVAGSWVAFAFRIRPMLTDFQAHLERVGSDLEPARDET